jgi:peptide deformylase
MSVKEIMLYPEKEAILRKHCEPVKDLNHRERRLIRDLKDTLKHHPEAVGLAAPQINVHSRVVVVRLGIRDASQDDPGPPTALINPIILESGSEKRDFDGCLSFPGLYAETVRPHSLRITALEETGEPFDRRFEDFDAVVVHHEIDHLDGVLFIDRVKHLGDLYRIVLDENGRPVRVPLTADLSLGWHKSIIN